MTLEKQTERGPKKRQSKESLETCLRFAQERFEGTGSFGGAIKWGSLVAAFEKALGLPVTPEIGETGEAGRFLYNLNNVKVATKTIGGKKIQVVEDRKSVV